MTARPNKKEKNNIKHHIYGVVDLNKKFSTGQWLKLVEKKIKEIRKKNKIPIISRAEMLSELMRFKRGISKYTCQN